MDKRSKFTDLIKYRAGALCLSGILMTTFMHTTTFMSQFFGGNLILGGISALAIDAGVIAASIFKDELIRDGRLVLGVRIAIAIAVIFFGGCTGMIFIFTAMYFLADHISTNNLIKLHQVKSKRIVK